MTSMTTAKRDQIHTQEISKYLPHVDATVMSNLDARDAYLNKVQACFVYRYTLPESYASTAFNAFIVRSGSGAGNYKNFYSIPSTLTSEEYSDIIPFRSILL